MATVRKTYDEQSVEEPLNDNTYPDAIDSIPHTPEQTARTFPTSNPVLMQRASNRGLWFVLALAAAFVIGFTFWMLVWAPRSATAGFQQSALGTLTEVAAIAWGVRS